MKDEGMRDEGEGWDEAERSSRLALSLISCGFSGGERWGE